jgi:uncharacterized protein YabE (DUF348 family)
LGQGDTITLTRVEEQFNTEQEVIPFERQIIRNETLAEGETRLVQAGVNGLGRTSPIASFSKTM